MAQIPIGTVGEYKARVTSDISISFMGVDGARVLSTPEMIRLMEHACRDAVLPLLDSGHDTVGRMSTSSTARQRPWGVR
jgi:predicted thioesterase